MNTVVTVSGPIFRRPELTVAAAEAMSSNLDTLRERYRANLSGGIVRRGPGRYGHLADAITSELHVRGDTVTGRVFPAGKQAFRAVFLEKGTKMHGIIPRRRRGRLRARRGNRAALRFSAGGRLIFASHVLRRGTSGYHIAARTLAQLEPTITAVYDAAIKKALDDA